MSIKLEPKDLARYQYLLDRINRDQAVVSRIRAQIISQYPEGVHEVESPGGTIVVSIEPNYDGDSFCFVNYKDEMGDGNAG